MRDLGPLIPVASCVVKSNHKAAIPPTLCCCLPSCSSSSSINRCCSASVQTQASTEDNRAESRGAASITLFLQSKQASNGHQDLHRVLLDVGPRGDAGGGDEEGRGVGGGRGGDGVACPGDAAGGGAGEDARGAQARGPPGDHGEAAGRRRRPPPGLPHPLRHDGGADEGVPRLHRRPLAGAGPRRQARRRVLRHGHPGRRAGDHRAHRRHAARPPRHALRAPRLQLRRRHVRRRRGQGRQPVRGRDLRRRRREQDAQRHRARHGQAPGHLLRRHSKEAQGLMSSRSRHQYRHTV